jgi:hypothetical protein
MQPPWQVNPQAQQYGQHQLPQHLSQQHGMPWSSQPPVQVSQVPAQMQHPPAQPNGAAVLGMHTATYPSAAYGYSQQQAAPSQMQYNMPSQAYRHPDGTPPHHLQPSGQAATANAASYGYPANNCAYTQGYIYHGAQGVTQGAMDMQVPFSQGACGAGQGAGPEYASDDLVEEDYEPEPEYVQQPHATYHAYAAPQQTNTNIPQQQVQHNMWATQQGRQGPAAQDTSSGRLRAVSELPAAFHPLFAGRFKYFNPVQVCSPPVCKIVACASASCVGYQI